MTGVAPPSTSSPSPEADAIFTGGRVHLVDAEDRVVGALAIRGGRILAAGEMAAVERHRGRRTLVVQLAGRSLVPGFIDNHIHLSNATQRAWLDVTFPGCTSIQAIVAAIAERAASTPPGQWVLARGFDAARLRERRFPNRHDLDAATVRHPVGISNREGMAWTFNTPGLRRLGVTDDTPDPPGGPLARDDRGRPLGPMWDNARTVFVNPSLPAPGLQDLAAAYAELARDLNAHGVTTAYEAAYRRAVDAAAWRHLQAAAPPTLRVVLGPYPLHGDRWDEAGVAGSIAGSGLGTGFGGPWLRLGALQLGVDGGILGRTAALDAPYSDDPDGTWQGSFRASTATLTAAVARALETGWQAGLICHGDAGIGRALDAVGGALEAVAGALPSAGTDHRTRLEHAYLWNPQLMDRAAELGIVWNTQPAMLTVAGRAGTIGPWGDRARWAFPFRSMHERGVLLSSGSDWGVGPLDPIAALEALVTHRLGPADGHEALNADETLSIPVALRALTLGSARAGFLESELGSLEPGKRADLAILDRDLTSLAPTDVADIGVDETWVGGGRVWRRGPAAPRALPLATPKSV
jgi:predicted amidohydrolase YtcJ